MSSPGRFCAEKQLRFEPLLAQGRGQRQIHCGRQVTELPGLRLWIVLCEMGEKGAVSKGKHAGGVVGHAIEGARQVVMERDIAVVPLVQRHEAQQVRRRFRSGGRAFAGPEEGGKVVSLVADGSFAEIETLGADFVLKKAASKLEVGI